ncbi:toxin-antitoxin system YwqK family antitoxin [Nocardiopsis lucentensis]|uniref:toxin-antitoxin system YwqK family antitoxin n=1 Tax=Nocardiopsis lucentensis TaxID=53441 RepID=UPI0003470C17|nr:hypothetical protein [Nocardiopsis lucentensis]
MRQVDEDDLDYPDELTALLDGEPFTGQGIEYEDGQPVELTTYVDGTVEGPQLKWSPSGQLLIQGNVRQPYGAVGPWHFWDEEGRLVRENIFDEKGNIRIIREWDESGNLTGEETHAPLWGDKDTDTGEKRALHWR